MATHAHIGIEHDDHIHWVYLHWDGNPGECGRKLLNWTERPIMPPSPFLRDLFELRDIGDLGPTPEASRLLGHTSDLPHGSANREDFLADLGSLHNCWEWGYLLTPEGWLYARGGQAQMHPLTPEVCEWDRKHWDQLYPEHAPN